MKTRLTNIEELSHYWAYNDDYKYISNAHCNSDGFYSYSTMIAKKVNGVVLLDRCNYSNTTAKQKNFSKMRS